jgi:hypothetical protein
MLHRFGVLTLNPNARLVSLAVSSPARSRGPAGCFQQLSKHPVCLSVILNMKRCAIKKSWGRSLRLYPMTI